MIRICRVKCSECGKTHALLLSSFVPYSQVPVGEQQEIAVSVEDGQPIREIYDDHPHIDDNCIKSIIRRYKKHWKERLVSESITLSPLPGLIRHCFTLYSAQFMQIRSTSNTLFSLPT